MAGLGCGNLVRLCVGGTGKGLEAPAEDQSAWAAGWEKPDAALMAAGKGSDTQAQDRHRHRQGQMLGGPWWLVDSGLSRGQRRQDRKSVV